MISVTTSVVVVQSGATLNRKKRASALTAITAPVSLQLSSLLSHESKCVQSAASASDMDKLTDKGAVLHKISTRSTNETCCRSMMASFAEVTVSHVAPSTEAHTSQQ